MSDDTRADDFPAIVANPADRDDVWMVYVELLGPARRAAPRAPRRGVGHLGSVESRYQE